MKALHRRFTSIETLETRVAPAVLFKIVDLRGDGLANDLMVKGGGGKEIVSIVDGTTTVLSIDGNADGDLTDPGDVNAMDLGISVRTFLVDMGGGNDTFNFATAANFTYNDADKSVNVNLGAGNNILSVNVPRITAGSDIRFDIQGGVANDYFNFAFQRVVDSRLTISGRFLGGADAQLDASGKQVIGRSRIAFAGNDDISNSSVHVDLDLGKGSNNFEFILGSDPGYQTNVPSSIDVNIAGSDVAKDIDDILFTAKNATLYGQSAMRMNVNLLGGNDRFTAVLPFDFNAFGAGSVFALDVAGGDGNDTIQVTSQGTQSSGTLGGLLDFNLRGEAGNDIINFDLHPLGGNGTDLRHGLRLFEDGGTGNDTLTASVAGNAGGVTDYDLALRGGSGDDTLIFFGNKNGGTATFGPGGRVLLDGGFGNNQAVTGGDFTIGRVNCANLAGVFAPGIITGDFDGNGSQDIRVTGNAGKNIVTVADGAGGATVTLDLNGDGDFMDPGESAGTVVGANTGTVILDLQGGDDQVILNFTNFAASKRSYLISLGAGKNSVSGGNTGSLESNSDISFEIEGGAANDFVNLTFGSISSSRLAVSALLGGGNDVELDSKGKVIGSSRIGVVGNGDVTTASMAISADLGAGLNRFSALLDSDVDSAANTSSSVINYHIIGSPKEADAVTVSFDNTSVTPGSKIQVIANLLGGNDTFTTTIPFNTAYRMVNSNNLLFGAMVMIDANGGLGNDTLAVLGTGVPSVDNLLDGLFDIALRGGEGVDKIQVDMQGTGNLVGFATGSTTALLRGLRLFLDGGFGNDKISALVAGQNAASFNLDVLLRGGYGKDEYVLNVKNDISNLTFKPGGSIVAEFVGLANTDKLTSTLAGMVPVTR